MILSRFVWFVLFAVLGFLTVWTSVQALRARDSKNWPTTNGVVTAFYGCPTYTYRVGGTTYTNSDASCNEFFHSFLSTQNSSKYAVRYPLEAKVTVHYHPGDPSIAALETEFDSSVVKQIVVLGGFTILFAAGFFFGWPLRGRVRWPVGG